MKLTEDKITSLIELPVEYQLIEGTTMTLCIMKLKGGIVIIGKSATISKATFDAAKGREYAYKDAIDQLWELEGYHQKRLLAEEATKEYPGGPCYESEPFSQGMCFLGVGTDKPAWMENLDLSKIGHYYPSTGDIVYRKEDYGTKEDIVKSLSDCISVSNLPARFIVKVMEDCDNWFISPNLNLKAPEFILGSFQAVQLQTTYLVYSKEDKKWYTFYNTRQIERGSPEFPHFASVGIPVE